MRETVIHTDRLTKRFGNFTAVDHISFDVGRGEIFGFLGANGAGKTTAMRMLCGLSRPTEGSGSVAGYDIATQPEMVKRNIGYMSQRFSLYEDLKVWENLRLFGGIYGLGARQTATKTNEMLCRLGLEGERDPAARRRFWELIYSAADSGITVFVTTHYMDEAEYCDRVSIMVDGRIEALDRPAALKRQFEAPTMDEVFRRLARKATRQSD